MRLFPNANAAWHAFAMNPALTLAPPAWAPNVPMSGLVTDIAGSPFEGVGVLVRTRFRVRLDDGNPADDPDAGFGDPIAVTVTDAIGAFEFERPAGGYQLEFF